MIRNQKRLLMRSWGLVALTCSLLFATSVFAAKGGSKTPPPPLTEWEVIFLDPSGDYTWSHANGTSGTQQAGRATTTTGRDHAGMWTGTAESWVDLNPVGASGSSAYGISGGQQVGYACFAGECHAILWSGTAESWVDLHPAGTLSSGARGIGDGQQVGSATVDGQVYHAILWTGSGESYIDLNPPGCLSSHAYGVSGGQQVGIAVVGDASHASLWTGSAQSWVDLHPSSSVESRANDVSDGQQVGSATFRVGWSRIAGEKYPVYRPHAGLWSGTPESWVDLHPVGHDGSEVHGVSHGYQAGHAYVSEEFYHAGIWSGTPKSWVDLGALLPETYGDSCAEDIDVTDTDIWVAGWWYEPTNMGGRVHAVLWHKRLFP